MMIKSLCRLGLHAIYNTTMEDCGLLLSVVKLGVFCEWMGGQQWIALGNYRLLGRIAELMHKTITICSQ